jgi:hypothetical protein
MATAYAPQPEENLPESGAMSDDELAAHLSEHEHRAIGYYESEIASEQADAIDRYYRRPYGDERTGRSQVVDGTVAITIDNALAAILKPFVSSEETVVFSPVGPEDEEIAEQATEYVNYVLHNDNSGFMVLHDWFKDALLQKVGVVKAYWEDYSNRQIERMENLDPIQLQTIESDDCRIIDGPFGPNEFGLYTVDVERIHRDGKLCVENIPPEEYRISPFARPGRIPPYEAHVTRKSKSELIEMKFDPATVKSLSKSANNGIDDTRAIARYEDEQWGTNREDMVGTEANDLVDFNDEFVLIDYDGDGVSELRRVMRSGNVILYNEQVDYSLFAKICPCPMPHKIYGLSVADQVKDEQRIATVLWRQTLDNLYLSNNPRPVVAQNAERSDGSTINDLLDDAPGSIIRTAANGEIGNFAVAFVADKAFPMLSYVEQQAESRTGISKHGQGLDPDALDKAGQITATQSAIEEEGRNSRAEMIGRIFAETGVRDLFRLMLKILVNHQPKSRIVRLRNKWVEMDPRSWNADMDVTISVGLGMGSKAQQMVTAQTVLATMETLGASPFASLLDPEKVYNGVKRLFNAAGIKNVDDYLNEPQRDQQGNLQTPPPPPDPKMMVAQNKMQLDQMTAQHQAQMAEASQSLKQMQAQTQAQIDVMRANSEAELGAMRLHMQAALDAMQAGHDMHLSEQKAAHDHEIARTKAEADAKLQKFRSGGKLDE